MVALRDIVLRKPLGLSYTEAYLQKEINDQLLGCYSAGEVTVQLSGCCILTPIDQHIIQLRQMAVAPAFQGLGIGSKIIAFAEKLSRDDGYTTLTLHARQSAQGFYEKLGYQVQGPEFLEVGIPHYAMNKTLGMP